MLVLGQGDGQFVVGFDQGDEGILVWSGICGVDVVLDDAGGGATPVGEFFDEFVLEHLGRRRGLDELDEELRGCLGLGDACGEFFGLWEPAMLVLTGGIVIIRGLSVWLYQGLCQAGL